ncbi:MAG: P-loop NTPase fold protein [Trebonia sp.]
MLLSDNPIPGVGDDEFGFREHAGVLCDAIADTTQLPFTVGVFGPWGSGKSSFLNICRDLLGTQGFVTAEFNPWKYDGREEIWHALIQSLLDELIRLAEKSPNDKRLQKALKKAWELRTVAAWLMLRSSLPLVTGGIVTSADVGAVQDALTAINQEQHLNYRHVNVFEKDFSDTVRALTSQRRMVVLIDDLDRCRGESALRALEALRLFTGDAPCVFVIAMDHQALIEAASAHFGNDEVRGRNYLEKLINFPYYLPTARFESINRSLRNQLEFLADDTTIWELIRANMGGNPRRIRRFVNTFNLAIATLARGTRPTEERQRQVAVLLMFRQEYPTFFEMLRRDVHVWAELEGAADSRADGNTDMPPHLASLVKSDRGILNAIASVSPTRKGFNFPPPPTEAQLTIFTEAMVLMPLPPQPLVESTSLTTGVSASIVR